MGHIINITLKQIYNLENKITAELKSDKVIKIKYVNLDYKPVD